MLCKKLERVCPFILKHMEQGWLRRSFARCQMHSSLEYIYLIYPLRRQKGVYGAILTDFDHVVFAWWMILAILFHVSILGNICIISFICSPQTDREHPMFTCLASLVSNLVLKGAKPFFNGVLLENSRWKINLF